MKAFKHPLSAGFFITAVILLTACSPKQVGAQTGPAAAQAASTFVQTVAQPIDANVASSLTKLGFHVFPTPVDLPGFTVKALSGDDLHIEELAGTITILNFWATWCPPCKGEMPSIQRLNDIMKGTAFRIVAVSTGESAKTVDAFIKANHYTYPIYLDEGHQLGAAFASQGIPSTYILDKNGRVIAGIVGSREYDDPELVALLKELAAK